MCSSFHSDTACEGSPEWVGIFLHIWNFITFFILHKMCNIKYGYNSPEYFCDQKKETEKIISVLYNERNLILIAPRRMEKTGLIKNVFHRMKDNQKKTLSSINVALKILLNKEIFYNTSDGYIVYDCFFGKWLKNVII